MKHLITVEIPDGKYCNSSEDGCPCLVGELHSMCFISQEVDLEEEGNFIIKAKDCPNGMGGKN